MQPITSQPKEAMADVSMLIPGQLESIDDQGLARMHDMITKAMQERTLTQCGSPDSEEATNKVRPEGIGAGLTKAQPRLDEFADLLDSARCSHRAA